MAEPLLSPAGEPRPPRGATWGSLDAIWVALLALVATFVVSTALVALVRPEGTAFILAGLAFEVALAVFSVGWVALRHRRSLPALGLVTARPVGDFLSGVAVGVGLFALTVLVVAPAIYTLISLVTGTEVQVPQQDVLPSSPTRAQVLLAGAVVVIMAPLGEELFFRGLLFGALRRRFRFPLAAAVSGVVFAAFHILPLLMPLMFFVGVGLAYIYERRGSLFASIAAHAAFNVIGFTFIVQALT